MAMSLRRLKQAQEAIKQSSRKKKQDIQTWLSAALTVQETCKEEAEADEPHHVYTRDKMNRLIQLSSNSLGVANRIPEDNSSTPGHHLPDNRFPGWLSTRERRLLQSYTIKADAIVAGDGSGDFKTISEAVQAANGDSFVIYVKAGVYSEKVNINKDGIRLIGDGKDSTVISGSSSVNLARLRYTVTGDGFIARNIRFHTTAGPKGQQAMALYITSDRSPLFKCSIEGYQDMLNFTD
ncbi:esterase [Lithospermum erythrorhizon]|uniref:Esterase n=1 Tax=Lithospermum erythrorhizon TaxID=34254 RepID=A0AAV3QZF6_LITER